MQKYRFLAAVSAVVLAGCGGGGGGSGGAGGIAGGPATPAPTPTPPPVAAVRFAASATGPVIGQAVFDMDANGNFAGGSDVAVATNRGGEFGQAATGRLVDAATQPPSETRYALRVGGVDGATGFYYTMYAPAGASVVSPLTSLIYLANDMTGVREALGLNSGAAPLRATTDILNLDAVREAANADPAIALDAGRINAINVQLLGIALLARNSDGDPVEAGLDLREGLQRLAQAIRETGSGRLTDPALIRRVLALSPSGQLLQPEQLDVAAELVAEYESIVPDRINEPAVAAAYQRLFRFYVKAEIIRLSSQYPSPDIARIRALTPADIQSQLSIFTGLPAPDVTRNIIAAPDLRFVSGGLATLSGCASIPLWRMPFCNDILLNPLPGMFNESFYSTVSVDAPASGRIRATLTPQGTIAIEAVNGYTGYTYFDYRVRSATGEESTSRTYVLFLP